MDEEALEIVSEHQNNLKRIDKKTAALLALFLSSVTDSLGGNDYELHLGVEAAAAKFNAEHKSMLDEAVSASLSAAKSLSLHNISAYRARVEKMLANGGYGYATTAAVLVTMEPYLLSSVFGGGWDSAIVGRVTGKVWPDGMMVSDRVRRLSERLRIEAEKLAKQGTVAGLSTDEIAGVLASRFENGPERRAALRLAVHTANSVFYATQAEIVRDVPFIEGIHIQRAQDGSEKCAVCFEHAGPVGGEGKKYFKTGGDDLWIMVDQPPYHVNCRCIVEEITEPVTRFIGKHT